MNITEVIEKLKDLEYNLMNDTNIYSLKNQSIILDQVNQADKNIITAISYLRSVEFFLKEGNKYY